MVDSQAEFPPNKPWLCGTQKNWHPWFAGILSGKIIFEDCLQVIQDCNVGCVIVWKDRFVFAQITNSQR